MSRATVIDVRAIARVVVQAGRRQVNRVRQLVVATTPFLDNAWCGIDDWPAVSGVPSIDYADVGRPIEASPQMQPSVVEPVREPTVDELLAVLSQHGLCELEVTKLPAGAVRIDLDQRQPEYVRVR